MIDVSKVLSVITTDPVTPRRKLGLQHLSYLRAIAEGIDSVSAATRYLDIEHGHEAITAHREIGSLVRAIAKRRGLKVWRLGGMYLPPIESDSLDKPSFEDYVANKGLEDWSVDEAYEIYLSEYPDDDATRRKMARREKLRKAQLAMYREIQLQDIDTAHLDDVLDAWMLDANTQLLLNAGIQTLGDLINLIRGGGNWYRNIPTIGEGKAEKIKRFLTSLFPGISLETEQRFFEEDHPEESGIFESDAHLALAENGTEVAMLLDSVAEANRLLTTHAVHRGSLLAPGTTDEQAVATWVRTRASSTASAKSYTKEGRRFLLWLSHEAGQKTLESTGVEQCLAYMNFLQNIPDRWISRTHASPMTPGWAPFRGQLSHTSIQYATTVVASLFRWLAAVNYIPRDPWQAVNLNTGDERGQRPVSSKALSENVVQELLGFIEKQPPSPSQTRIKFIILFLEAVGLRSSELLACKLGDFELTDDAGWQLHVHGKGAKNRIVAIPQQALTAANSYLHSRALPPVGEAAQDVPLLANVKDPEKSISYPTLYLTVRMWFARALAGTDLGASERIKLGQASTHWLRHTFGTRAVAREVPMDVIQAQLGHASIETTMSIYGRAPAKRRAEEIGKAFK